MKILLKNSNKSKRVHTGYGIAFDGGGSWNFGNDFVKNIVIFGFDNSSSSHVDNQKNNFLVQVKDHLLTLMEAIVQQKKSIVLTIPRQRQNFA